MENKKIRAIWYSFAATFFLISGVFNDASYIFSPLAGCCIIIGNMRSRKL